MNKEFENKIFVFRDVAGNMVRARFVEWYLASNGNKLIKVEETKFNYIFLLKPEDKNIKWKVIDEKLV